MSNSRFGLRTRSGSIAAILESFNNVEGLIFKIDSSDPNSYSVTGIQWVDLSGYGTVGTLNNGVSYQANNLKSLYFDGTNDYVSFGNSNKLNSGNRITVFSIFRISSTKGYQPIITKKGEYVSWQAYTGWEFANSNGLLRATLSPSINNSNNANSSDQILEVDRWYIAAFTYNGSKIRLYLDGVFITEGNVTSPYPVLDGTGELFVGVRPEGPRYKGNILYCSIHSKALNDTEILEQYNNLKSKTSVVSDGLVLHLDPTNTTSYSGVGIIYQDLSGNGYNATLYNTPTFDSISKTFKLNGMNQYIGIGNNPDKLFPMTSNYTWTAWLNFGPPIDPAQGYRQIWYGNAGGGDSGFGLTLMPMNSGYDNSIKVEIYGTIGSRQNKYLYFNTDIYDTWNHWTFAIDQSNFTISVYLNSTFIQTLSFNDWGTINKFQNYVSIGSLQNSYWFYDGSIGEILVYERKLDQSEIGKNYTLTKYKYAPIDDCLLMHLDAGNLTSYPGNGTTWYDISGNSNHATLVGAFSYSKEKNGSLISDGLTSYVTTTLVVESPSTSPYTYEISFKLDSLDVGYYSLIGKSEYLVSGFFLGISSVSNSSDYTVHLQASTPSFYNLSFNLTKNTHNVYTIAVVINGTNVTLYQNSVQKVTGTLSADIVKNNSGINIVGFSSGGWESAPIRIYSVKVYNKALIQREITRNWNFIKNRYLKIPIVTGGLRLYLDGENLLSNPRSGSTWTDLSGYGNNATLNNGPIMSNQNSGAIKFDGQNDYAIVGNSSNLNFGTGDFTIMMWISGVRSYPGGGKTLIRKGAIFDNGYPGWAIAYAGFPQELYIIVSGPTTRNEYSISGLSGGWEGYKLIGLQRKSNVLYFINDGVLTSLVATDGKNVNNSEPIEISYNSHPYYGNTYLKCEIGMVAAYNRALSTDEILLNYNVTKNKYKDKTFVTSGLQLNLDAGKTASYYNGSSWIDLSNPTNSATMSGGFTFSSANQGSLVFDGINGKADFYSPNLNTTVTVEMWVKIPSSNNSGRIIYGFDRYNVYILNDSIGFNTGNSDLYGISGLNTLGLYDSWHHFLFVMRSDVHYSANKIYIDGEMKTLSQIQGSENSTNRSTFNGGNGSISTWRATVGYFMPQSVGIFRIYNRELTSTEVLQNFNATKQRYLT